MHLLLWHELLFKARSCGGPRYSYATNQKRRADSLSITFVSVRSPLRQFGFVPYRRRSYCFQPRGANCSDGLPNSRTSLLFLAESVPTEFTNFSSLLSRECTIPTDPCLRYVEILRSSSIFDCFLLYVMFPSQRW